MTGETLSNSDNSSIRSFVARAIIADRATTPVSVSTPAATTPPANTPAAFTPPPVPQKVQPTTMPLNIPVALQLSPTGKWGWHTLFDPVIEFALQFEDAIEFAAGSFHAPVQLAGDRS